MSLKMKAEQENGQLKVLTYNEMENSLESNKKYMLEYFFDKVSYENKIEDSSEFIINVKDKIVQNLDYSQIHLLVENNYVLVYLQFRNSRSNKANHLLKIDLKFQINLSTYNVELNEDYMKIVLYVRGRSDEIRNKKFSDFQKEFYKKLFFRKVSTKVFRNVLYENSGFIHLKKVKRNLFEMMKSFYFISLKEKINKIKVEKMRKKFHWKEFYTNYTNYMIEYKKDKLKLHLYERNYLRKLFFIRSGVILDKSKLPSKEIKNIKYTNIKDSLNKKKKLFYFNKLFGQMKVSLNKKKLKTHQRSISNKISAYFYMNKTFKILKLEYQKFKYVSNQISEYYLNKVKIKILIGLKQNFNLGKKRLNRIQNYNKFNYSFLNFICGKFMDIKKSKKQSINPDDVSVKAIIGNHNEVIQEFKDHFYNHFYYYRIKNAMNLIKNNYFRKLIIYSKLTKIAYKVLNIWKYEDKNKFRRYVNKIQNFKFLQRERLFTSFFRIIIHMNISGKSSKLRTQLVRRVNLIRNYDLFIRHLSKINLHKKNEMEKKEIYKDKFIKFKFFHFISALFLKKQKSQEKNTRSQLMSPRTIFKKNMFSLQDFSKKYKTSYALNKLKTISKKEKIFNEKRAKSKLDLVIRKHSQIFLTNIRRQISISNFNKKLEKNKIKNFFLKINQLLIDKNLLICASKSRNDKLKEITLFLLKVYSKFKKEKEGRYNFFQNKLDYFYKEHYLNSYFRRVVVLKYKEKEIRSMMVRIKKESIFKSFKKLFVFRRIRSLNNNYLCNSFFDNLKSSFEINRNLQKSYKKFNKIIKKKYLNILKKKTRIAMISDSIINSSGNLNLSEISKNKLIHKFTSSGEIKALYQKFCLNLHFKQLKQNLEKAKFHRDSKLHFYRKIFLTKIKLKINKGKILNKSKNDFYYKRFIYWVNKNRIISTNQLQLIILYKNYLTKSILIKARNLTKLVFFCKILSRINSNLQKHFLNFFFSQIKWRNKFQRISQKLKKINVKSVFNKLHHIRNQNKDILVSITKFKSKHYLSKFMKNILATMIESNIKTKLKKLVFRKYLSVFRNKLNVLRLLKQNHRRNQLSERKKSAKYSEFFEKVKLLKLISKIKKNLEIVKMSKMKGYFMDMRNFVQKKVNFQNGKKKCLELKRKSNTTQGIKNLRRSIHNSRIKSLMAKSEQNFKTKIEKFLFKKFIQNSTTIQFQIKRKIEFTNILKRKYKNYKVNSTVKKLIRIQNLNKKISPLNSKINSKNYINFFKLISKSLHYKSLKPRIISTFIKQNIHKLLSQVNSTKTSSINNKLPLSRSKKKLAFILFKNKVKLSNKLRNSKNQICKQKLFKTLKTFWEFQKKLNHYLEEAEN